MISMINNFKRLMILSVVLLTACEQYNLDNLVCEKEARKISALEQKLAIKIPVKNDSAALMKQLEQVTTELVEVKIQRDIYRQDLAAYKKKN